MIKYLDIGQLFIHQEKQVNYRDKAFIWNLL